MDQEQAAASRAITRRRALAGGAAGASAALGGCIREVRNVVRRAPDNHLSLSISTVPGDDDPQAIQLATALQEALELSGVDADLSLFTREELHREILINHDYDLFVARHPGGIDPDFLYEAFHSKFADEWGWQNPFGFAHIPIDNALERQRRGTGEQRRDDVTELLWAVVNEQVLTPICRPTECRLVGGDRFDGWDRHHLGDRLAYVAADPDSDVTELRGVITDVRPTKNLNPISAEYRDRGIFVDLLYDSLGTYDDDEIVPWLAEEWEWEDGDEDDESGTNDGDERGTEDRDESGADDDENGTEDDDENGTEDDDENGTEDDDENGTEDDENGADYDDETGEGRGKWATVRLRSATWHDGEPLTAADVAFTYRFLADTTLGKTDVPSPAPLYRGRATAIEEVRVVSDNRLRIRAAGGPEAAENAFTVPILPEHVWADRTDEAEFPGVDTAEGTTEAVVTDNVPPIGSGPFAFVDRSERDRIELERHEDHFALNALDLPTLRTETFRIDVVPSTGAAIEAIEEGDADVTISPLDPEVVDAADLDDDVAIVESPSRAIYCVGFNTRAAPLQNANFRRTVASLLDKENLVEEVFAGKAEPIASPVTGEWLTSSLEWADSDPITPFLGTDGELDETAAREAFEEHGYRYDEDGNLLVRN
ncbi:ABC transporter substrate-binding protein [Halovivax sp.]|uniref:ABC transporter substrate-binding protein n=1 Tax=Halovivax sp. TaxID=1935978 RepID=UPI0025BFAE42|nr:ABC transporter substrate-binding protein [Halovivax sp.]